jgi:hypothetical protein
MDFQEKFNFINVLVNEILGRQKKGRMMNFSLGIGRSDQNLVWKTKKILEQRL